MKIYLISQSTNSDYDTYDSAVVAAETEEIVGFQVDIKVFGIPIAV